MVKHDPNNREESSETSEPEIKTPPGTAEQKACRSWLLGICDRGPKCENMHSWYFGDCFSMVAKIETENSKAVFGIALPHGSEKLYACGNGGTLNVWDCHTGQSVRVVNLMAPVRCMTTLGTCLLLGSKNAVIAWNTEGCSDPVTFTTGTEPLGQICAMDIGNGMLFAGADSGKVVVFRCSTFGASTTPPQLPVAIFKDHTEAITSIVFGPNTNRLYTGSSDSSIKVWDLSSFSCVLTVAGHTRAVTSLIFWGTYLLSGSYDRSVKVWAPSEDGGVELMYTQDLQYGAVALKAIHDAHGKAFLLCSCNDNADRVYDLLREGKYLLKKKFQP